MYEEIKYDKEFAKTFSEETRKSLRKEYIENNIPFAKYVANKIKIKPNGIYDKEDIIQVSNLGLIAAVDNFNFKYDVKFSTYAYQSCFGYILRYLRDSVNSMRVPRELYSLGNRIYDLSSRGYSDEEIIEMVGSDNFLEASNMRRVTNVLNLEYQVRGRDGTSTSIVDFIPDSRVSNEESLCSNMDLERAIEKLGDREKTMIKLYYFEDMNQREIASILNTSQVQVSRIISKSLKKLKEELTHDE